jgi:hypothetical protein
MGGGGMGGGGGKGGKGGNMFSVGKSNHQVVTSLALPKLLNPLSLLYLLSH